MKQTGLIILFMAAIFLAGCAPLSSAGQSSSANPTGGTATLPEPPQATSTPVNAPKMECQVVSLSPTPGPTEVSMFPPAQADDWVLGSENAKLTITEYSDFQCPYCALLAQDLKVLLEKHPADVRVVFRHFPLPSHPLALMAASGSEAAGRQGKFWEMQDAIFASQQVFSGFSEEEFKSWLLDQARQLGLDAEQFAADMNDQAIIDKVKTSQQHGIDIGIPGTPFVLLNGNPYQGPRDAASFEAVLGLLKLEDVQYTYCPEMVIDPQREYTATLKTEKGSIVIQLFADKAPLAANSFVFLAREGWLNGTTFFRVLSGTIAQAGDPSGLGMGNPGYFFRQESNDLTYDKPGMVGMLNMGGGYNGSQFFITLKPLSELNGNYTIVGEVIDGMDVLKKLTVRDPSQQLGLPSGDMILSVEVKEK